jgi:hypothetical protein
MPGEYLRRYRIPFEVYGENHWRAASQICLHPHTGMCADYGVAAMEGGKRRSPAPHLIIQIRPQHKKSAIPDRDD